MAGKLNTRCKLDPAFSVRSLSHNTQQREGWCTRALEIVLWGLEYLSQAMLWEASTLCAPVLQLQWQNMFLSKCSALPRLLPHYAIRILTRFVTCIVWMRIRQRGKLSLGSFKIDCSTGVFCSSHTHYFPRAVRRLRRSPARPAVLLEINTNRYL